MYKYKIGSFVRYNRGKFKETCQIIDNCLIENHQSLSNGLNVHNDDLEYWIPQEGELVIIGCTIYKVNMSDKVLFEFINKCEGYELFSTKRGINIQDFCEPYLCNIPKSFKEI